MSSPDQSPDSEPRPRLPPARVWVVGGDGVAAALAAASDRVDPIPVDPERPPAEPPSAVVAAGHDALDAALPAVETALVGADVDPAAGYEAGADAVVPVDPTASPGPLVAWLERAVERADEAARYRALFDETGDGVVVHDAATGDVVEVNDRFRELLGLDADEPVTVETFAGADEEHGAERARAMVRTTAERGTARTFEWTDHPPDDDPVEVAVTLSPATLGGRERVVATVRDVTERRERRERFERTLERVDDAFFAVDEDWTFTYLNEAGASVINGAARGSYSVAELRGRNIWELIPDAVDTRFYEEYHAAMERQEARRFESYYPPLDAWFEVRAYPSPEGLSVYFSEVTERREHEDAVRELFDTARALMSAESRTAVAERLAEAATGTLGYAATTVRLRTPDGRLDPVARGGTAPADPRTLSVEDTPHGRALRGGSPVVDELAPDDPPGRGGSRRALYVPVGDHGVLALGRTAGQFDDGDRRLARLLAALGEAAFDRVERAAELRRYEAVLETAEGMVFVVDEDRRFSLVTEPLAAHLGYDRDQIVGRHVSDVLDEEAVAETGAIREALRASPGDGSQTFEVDVRAADGSRVPLAVELTAFDHGDERGTVGVVTDRSALQSVRADLATERDRLSYLFENLPDPTAEYDVDPLSGESVVRSVNPAFCDAFGVDRETALGRPLSELVPDARAPDAPERLAGVDAGEVVRAEVDRTADGDARRFLFRGVSFRADDRLRAFGIYTDITDRHRRERYLQVVGRVLRHNLRNDLNVVLALVSRLRTAVADEEAAASLDQIDAVVRDLVDTGEDARDLARLVGGGAVERTTVDLAALARSVAAAAPGPVDVDLPDDLRVVTDARLERALAEVIENALEHAPDPDRPPRITAETDADWVRLRVDDDGPGIPETEREVVTGDREITQTQHGSGLGLWIARLLVEAAGGHLSFPDTDDGTVVVFALPRA